MNGNILEEPIHFEALEYTSPGGREYFTPKCDEKYKPHVDRAFPTVDAAYEFYREYGRLCGFDVRKSSAKHAPDGTLIRKYIECSWAGTYDKNKQTTSEVVAEKPIKRRRTSSRRCDCNAMIKVKYAGLSGYVVSYFVEDHNHALASASDFKNFKRDMRARIGPHDADMILDKFSGKYVTSKKTFYYEYKQDNDGHLTGLFWADAIGKRNYSIFGDTLSFDPTYRTNKYCMLFIPFIGVDNHWSNVTFAAALVEKEDHTNIKWALDAFTKCMDHIPPCVITDQCLGINKVVSLVWPETIHRYYGWTSVIDEYDLGDNDWLTDMHVIRKEWIPAYFNNVAMAGLLRTTSRSGSSNFYFKHFHKSGDTLLEFFSKYESAIEKQRHLFEDNNQLSISVPIPATELKIEIDAAKIYTRQLYYRVREEIESAWYHTSIDEVSLIEGVKQFKIKDALLKGRLFEVTVRLADHDVNCECKFYVRRGYLCRHAFASLHQCGVSKIH
ncbi:protein FAR1-RELATED SEQUENCE 5-like [Daucus carota subsp. sativus]|uniref:protein FAR1-RELATED SEQUENCE 5-like n=1 Tax=Daucus carota subsp. sativus TaxID=79200 RepID=UPI003082CC52